MATDRNYGEMARAYRDGNGVGKDLDLAIKYMRMSMENNEFSWARNELVDLLLVRGKDDDLNEVKTILEAHTDDPWSNARMARLYRDGRIYKKDVDRAIKMMSDAASGGVKWAVRELLDMIWKSKNPKYYGVFREKSERYAAEGDPYALFYLASAYRDGFIYPRDLEKAKSLMCQAVSINAAFWEHYVKLLIILGSEDSIKEAFQVACRKSAENPMAKAYSVMLKYAGSESEKKIVHSYERSKGVYARGYFISFDGKELEDLSEDWIATDLPGNINIQYDKANEYGSFINGDNWAALLGKAILINDPSKSIGEISSIIASSIGDEEKLWEVLDNICGRYLVLYGDGKTVHIQTDALGMRSAYYSSDLRYVASHYGMIEEIVQNPLHESFGRFLLLDYECQYTGKPRPHCLPADFSPYLDIRLLVPNHELEMPGRMHRIWPRHNVGFSDIDTSAEFIAHSLRNVFEEVSKRYKSVVSLSMGNDSRMTLAASMRVKDSVRYFTYRRKSGNVRLMKDLEASCRFSEKVSAKEGLDYTEISTANKISDEDRTACAINTYYDYERGIIPLFRKLPNGVIHVKTNSSEIIRRSAIPYRTGEIGELFNSWSSYNVSSDPDYFRREWLDYYSRLEWDKIYGHDLNELFFWEYRSGVWVGPTINQCDDIVFDTFNIFDSRAIIEKGLYIPRYYKDRNVLVYEIIRILWPDLLQYGIPNNTQPLEECVDHDTEGLLSFEIPLAGKKNFTVISGHAGEQGSVPFVFEPHLTSVGLGFSSDMVKDGDFVQLNITANAPKGPCAVQFNIFVPEIRDVDSDTYYEVSVNEKTIHTQNLSENKGIINQIVHVFDSSASRVTLGIRIVAEGCPVKNYLGNISIKGISVKSLKVGEIKESTFSTIGTFNSLLDDSL